MGTTADELRYQLAEDRSAVSRDLEAIGDRVSPSRMAERRTAAVKQRVSSVRERLMGAADHATDSVRDTASSMADSVSSTVSSAPDATRRATQGSPIALGLIAFGAGAVIAALLPESDAESRLVQKVQPQLEQAAASAGDAAQQAAQSMKESIQPAVQDAADDLKQHAQDAASTVKDAAQQAASTTASDAKDTVQSARNG